MNKRKRQQKLKEKKTNHKNITTQNKENLFLSSMGVIEFSEVYLNYRFVI